MTDLERQGITAARTAEYGSVELDPKKGAIESTQKLPLLLGRWEVHPDKLYKIAFTAYVAWFVVHRVADIAYILTVDARFPAGLEHLYKNEAQRLDSVAYTRQTLMCGLLHRCVVFAVVVSLVYFQLFARFDTGLRSFYAGVANWWANCYLVQGCTCCCAPLGRGLGACWALIAGTRPGTWCGKFKDHACNGRLVTEIQDRFGFKYSIKELLHGAFYLSLIAGLFFAMSLPFMYWSQWIDLKFGFANSLSVSLKNFQVQACLGLISMIISGIPQKFALLCVLQYRPGWVFMWAGLIIGMCYAQFNVGMMAGALGMDNKFPTASFAVGRGFPLQQTNIPHAPWISLNRLFFPNPYQYFAQTDTKPVDKYYTMDKSKGPLALMHQPDGHWVISGNPLVDSTVYTKSASASEMLDGLREQSWTVGGQETKVGVRSGKELRDKLFKFASDRRIGIGDIYMVDGSHRDARANAFVAGAGNHSIIALYDTLFLGQRGADATEDSSEKQDDLDDLAEGKALIQHASEVVQDVDIEEETRSQKKPRNSAVTVAMSDDEIVAILAHELAHSALKHMEQGLVTQVFTSFVTFAAMGWMASSPLAAAALSLQMPVLHIGACAYDHVVGPPLEGFMKFFTDGQTRHNEYEADGYAAMISERYADAMQSSLAKLSVNSNQDPDVPLWYDAMHSDHPTFSMRWAHIQTVREATYGKKKKP